MTAPYLGGHSMTRIRWVSAQAISVEFSSTYGSSYYHQLYAGRTLVGVSASAAARNVIGELVPTTSPQPLQLLAVSPGNRNTDYGESLPLRPYNKLKLKFTVSSYPSDALYLDVTAGTTPGGAVDSINLLKRITYDADREYEVVTPSLNESGTWNFEVAGRDNRLTDGNLGTALAISGTVLVHPPDVTPDSNGNRLSVSVASQQATVSYDLNL